MKFHQKNKTRTKILNFNPPTYSLCS